MGIERTPRERLVDGEPSWLGSDIVGWLAASALRAASEQHVDALIAMLSDFERARNFREAIPNINAEERDYLPSLITVNDGIALIGVRFRDGGATAFVEAYALSTLSEWDDIQSLVNPAIDRYAVFDPLFLRIHHAPEFGIEERVGDAKVDVDFITYAGRGDDIDNIRELPPGWQVVAPARLDFYDAYVAAYDTYIEGHPELRGRVVPEPLTTLAEASEANLLRVLLHEGRWQGVIAARPDLRYMMRGYAIIENCLATEARGCRLATPLLTHFARSLPLSADEFIFGAIDPLNVPSQRTAVAAGRVPVMHASRINPPR